MRRKHTFIGFAFLGLLSVSCASTQYASKREAFAGMYGENPPVSILVMPPINTSTSVEAKDYFYYTLSQPLANHGYYVYPALLSMQTLQTESAYDSELFIEGDISKFGSTFGADLLLFTTITNWEKHGVAGSVDVGVEYLIRSTSTGDTVYKRKGTFRYNTATQGSGGGLIALAVRMATTAIKTAVTDYVSVARSCNVMVLGNLPNGKYTGIAGADGDESPGSDNVSMKATYFLDY